MLKKCMFGIGLILTLSLGLISCSSDDDGDSRDCDSCSAQGQTLEICDNGDGTFTLSGGGESETFPASDLEGVDPSEFIGLICELANLGS
jgi:hypothetical protein